MNDKIDTKAYPVPCIEIVFSEISGAKFFAKIDLSKAYGQIALDKKSHKVCTVNTTQAFFRVTRLQQGMKIDAAICQQNIEKMLKRLTRCIGYQNDILRCGVTDAELEKRYNAVMERFTGNENKCVSNTATFFFLVYEVTYDHAKLEPKHTNILQHLPSPKNVKELETFIGLPNYFD